MLTIAREALGDRSAVLGDRSVRGTRGLGGLAIARRGWGDRSACRAIDRHYLRSIGRMRAIARQERRDRSALALPGAHVCADRSAGMARSIGWLSDHLC